VASLLWFLAGKQSLSNRSPLAAIGWQSVAVLIVLIMCRWAVVQKEWLGLAGGIVGVYFEVRSVMRVVAAQRLTQSRFFASPWHSH
jgi:hypothetical protein